MGVLLSLELLERERALSLPLAMTSGNTVDLSRHYKKRTQAVANDVAYARQRSIQRGIYILYLFRRSLLENIS